MAEYGSTEEVAEALEGFSTADWLKLRFLARTYVRTFSGGESVLSASDLEQEALVATLEQRRPWRSDKVDLLRHLDQAMRSIRSNVAGKLARRKTWSRADLWRDACKLASPIFSAIRAAT